MLGSSLLDEAVAYVRERIPDTSDIGLILGSGLGDVADAMIAPRAEIAFADVPGLAGGHVEGHRGRIVAGRIEGVPCIALQGRRHLYEGYSPPEVALPARLLVRLASRALVLTNAAGGIHALTRAGSLMIIDDHINLLWRSPLEGPVLPGETRFPDLSDVYDPDLQRIAEDVALSERIGVTRGVYCAVTGPSYETPAEIRMLAKLGVHAVGMSTIPEALVARAAGVPVLAISLISNAAAGLATGPLSHEEVVAAGSRAAGDFARLLRGVVPRIARQS